MVPAAGKAAIMRESFAKASSKVLTSAAVNAKVVSQSEDREGARSRNSARPAWSCRRGDRFKRHIRCWHLRDMPIALRNVPKRPIREADIILKRADRWRSQTRRFAI